MVRAYARKVGHISFRESKGPTRIGLTSINSGLYKPTNIPAIGPSESRPRETKVNHITRAHTIPIRGDSSHINPIPSSFFRVI